MLLLFWVTVMCGMYLPWLVDRVASKFSTNSNASGVKMRPKVISCEVGRDFVLQLLSNTACVDLRSAVRL